MELGLRDWLALVADLLGVIGFLVTIWTLTTARSLRAEFRLRRRLPEIFRELADAHRQFRTAKAQSAQNPGARQECLPPALALQRLLGELASVGRALDVSHSHRRALDDLVMNRNFDQLESVEVLMHDAVRQAEEKVKALHD